MPRAIKFLKVNFLIIFISLSFTLVNCTSVKRYNEKLKEPISIEKLQKDVDYVQRKLEKLYPSLYQYCPKEQLNAKFDSVRKAITHPMTSKEFFFVMSPAIAAVKQGHMTLSVSTKHFTKKQQKAFKKAGVGPLSQFQFDWLNDKLYIVKNNSANKSIPIGAEVLSINAILPQDMYSKYRKTYTSDGYNKTFLPKFFKKRLSTYLVSEIGTNDSLTYLFKFNDSIKSIVIHRFKAVKKIKAKIAAKTVVEVKKVKSDRRENRIYGYDNLTKEYAKELKFTSNDSVTAVLRIRNFSDGNQAKAYAEIFEKIKQKKTQTLIIDIRDNPGGRVSDVVNLYSYLTDKEYVMLQKALVTSKTSLWKLGLFNHIPKVAYPFAGAFYPFYMGFSFIRTKKASDGNYYYALTGSKKRNSKPNHFSGKIYVLINGGSFSASCLLSSTLKSNPNATFVGEETGGAFNGTVAGLMPVVNLPNSKLALRLGLMDVKPINQTNVLGRGIFPDKEIVPTIEDKVNKKDPEMEWILNDIKEHKKP